MWYHVKLVIKKGALDWTEYLNRDHTRNLHCVWDLDGFLDALLKAICLRYGCRCNSILLILLFLNLKLPAYYQINSKEPWIALPFKMHLYAWLFSLSTLNAVYIQYRQKYPHFWCEVHISYQISPISLMELTSSQVDVFFFTWLPAVTCELKGWWFSQ